MSIFLLLACILLGKPCHLHTKSSVIKYCSQLDFLIDLFDSLFFPFICPQFSLSPVSSPLSISIALDVFLSFHFISLFLSPLIHSCDYCIFSLFPFILISILAPTVLSSRSVLLVPGDLQSLPFAHSILWSSSPFLFSSFSSCPFPSWFLPLPPPPYLPWIPCATLLPVLQIPFSTVSLSPHSHVMPVLKEYLTMILT